MAVTTYTYPSLTTTSTLPVGASTSANQATEIASLASIDGKITAVNTGAVVVSSSALPSGAATSAKQDTAQTSLTSIDGKITAVNTGAVVVSSSALPSGAATSAKQDTAQTSLTSIDGKITAINTGAVVVSSSALPSGAATSAKQDTAQTSLTSIDGKVPALGQALAAASVPVVLTAAQISTLTPPAGSATAANQTSVIGTLAAGTSATNSLLTGGVYNSTTPALTTGQQVATQMNASGSIQMQEPDKFITGFAPATAIINSNLISTTADTTTATDLLGYRSISLTLVPASATAITVNFEGSNDNVNFVGVYLTDTNALLTSVPVNTYNIATSVKRYFEGPLNYRYFRARAVAAITGGTFQAFTLVRPVPYTPTSFNLGGGNGQTIGTLVSNQSVNVAQINGVTTTMGNGGSGSGVQRVTIASDSTGLIAVSQTTPGTTNAIVSVGLAGSTGANSSLASTALEASHIIKASAGRLYQLTGVNTKSTAQYIQVFNSATVPADTTAPVLLCYVPAGSNFSFDFGVFGRYFSTGISVSNSSSAATKTIGSADCWFNAEYV